MKTFKVQIIDDDEIAIDELAKSLSKYPQFEIVGKNNNAAAGEKTLFAEQPDLLFLDVELPDMKGLELLNTIHDRILWDMKVIFYSSYEKYILSAMREAAFDFLLKPFDADELHGILERFIRHAGDADTHAEPAKAPECQGEHNFLISTVTGYRKVSTDDIGIFEHNNMRKLWNVYLNDGNVLSLKRGTSAEDILNYSRSFVQISQSMIINIAYLSSIHGKLCRLYPPFDMRTDLLISRGYLKKLQERLNFI
jgi:two-component system LytT family response regulator